MTDSEGDVEHGNAGGTPKGLWFGYADKNLTCANKGQGQGEKSEEDACQVPGRTIPKGALIVRHFSGNPTREGWQTVVSFHLECVRPSWVKRWELKDDMLDSALSAQDKAYIKECFDVGQNERFWEARRGSLHEDQLFVARTVYEAQQQSLTSPAARKAEARRKAEADRIAAEAE